MLLSDLILIVCAERPDEKSGLFVCTAVFESQHVQHQFSFRLVDLGFDWLGLFHLRQKAGVVQLDGGRNSHDGGVVFHRFCSGDVPGFSGHHGRRLFLGEAGLLSISLFWHEAVVRES